MSTRHRSLIVVVLSATLTSGLSVRADDPPAVPDFNTHIAPLFKKYCLGCHNATDAEHGLVLETYEGLFKGGDDGAVVVAGKSEASRLLLMLDGRAKPVMPPEESEAPTKGEIALIKSWIDAGAKSPTGAAPDPTLLVTPKIKVKGAPRRQINAAAWSPDGKRAALAGYGEVRIIATDSRATVRMLSGHRGNVTDVEFSKDGSRLLAAAGEPSLFGEAILWNVADGARLRTIVGHRDSLYAAAISPDGTLIATASYDQQTKLWNAETGAEVRTIVGHNGAVLDLAFSPNSKLLATASADRSVKLWDTTTGERLDTFTQPLKEVYTVSFSPDGRQVVAGGGDNRIRVWQISDTAKEGTNPLVYTRFAHEGAVIKLAFSPDGLHLTSAAEDRTVKLWDTAGYVEQRVLEAQPDWSAALAIGPDNKSLLVGRLDGSFAFYDLSTGALQKPPTPEITTVEPRGLERGVMTKVRITGKFLLDASSVKFDSGDFKVHVVVADEPNAEELWAEVTPAASLPRGQYQLAVVTPGGTSGPLPIEIDDLPQLAETEPNAVAAGLAPIALPASVWGTLAATGDVDHVTFDAQAGQTIVLDLAAKSLGSKLNAVIAVIDPGGQIVAASNYFGEEADPLLAYRVPVDGRYAVRIHDLAFTGSDKHFYKLTLGAVPFVTAVFPLSVTAGHDNSVALVGYNLPTNARVPVPSDKPGEIAVSLDAARFRSRRPLKVLVTDAAEIIEAEPNDQPEKATPLAVPGVAGGTIEARTAGDPADADLYRFESRQGQSWIIEIEAARRGLPLDSKIEVLDAQGRPIERLLLQAVRDSYIYFQPLDSIEPGFRAKNWEEMELNEFLYMQGEVCKVFRLPQGPDSGLLMYSSDSKRRCYFDTSARAHPIDENIYTVEPQPPGATLVSTGLPVFPLYYANDDGGERKLGCDSRLTFTAPADGAYLVRVSDVRGIGGAMFAYRLIVRQPKPDFRVRVTDGTINVPAGSGQRVVFAADRIDGFDGDITVEADGLPDGFTLSTPTVIQAGHSEARAVVNATADAAKPLPDAQPNIKLVAKAQINGSWVEKEVAAPKLGLQEKPQLIVHIEPAELSIAPGATIAAQLKVERHGFDDRIALDINNLPHGVIVDNIGLSGVLIPEGQNERQIFLSAAKWVPDMSCRIHAVANAAGTQASQPIMLHVRRPLAVTNAPQGK